MVTAEEPNMRMSDVFHLLSHLYSRQRRLLVGAGSSVFQSPEHPLLGRLQGNNKNESKSTPSAGGDPPFSLSNYFGESLFSLF